MKNLLFPAVVLLTAALATPSALAANTVPAQAPAKHGHHTASKAHHSAKKAAGKAKQGKPAKQKHKAHKGH